MPPGGLHDWNSLEAALKLDKVVPRPGLALMSACIAFAKPQSFWEYMNVLFKKNNIATISNDLIEDKYDSF
jgi:hypothetical protein